MFTELISLESYNLFLGIMAAIAVVVFVALYFVEAGYG
jgi:3-oxo-5-alpha-steroid 4-dehydrogenase 1